MGAIPDYRRLLFDTESIIREGLRFDVRLKKICKLLVASVPHYDWVGFYIASPTRRELLLGPYVGTPTDFIRLAYGSGLCGHAAESGATCLAQDVSREADYIPCSIHVRSEIVIPVRQDGRVVAVFDVDSHTLSAFTPHDERFLEAVAEGVAPIIQIEP